MAAAAIVQRRVRGKATRLFEEEEPGIGDDQGGDRRIERGEKRRAGRERDGGKERVPVIRNGVGKLRGQRDRAGEDLKRVLYMAAFCAAMGGDPLSRAYYDRKRRQGKRHTQALISLARRQTTVLWCMLKQRTFFDPDHRKAA